MVLVYLYKSNASQHHKYIIIYKYQFNISYFNRTHAIEIPTKHNNRRRYQFQLKKRLYIEAYVIRLGTLMLIASEIRGHFSKWETNCLIPLGRKLQEFVQNSKILPLSLAQSQSCTSTNEQEFDAVTQRNSEEPNQFQKN